MRLLTDLLSSNNFWQQLVESLSPLSTRDASHRRAYTPAPPLPPPPVLGWPEFKPC